MNKLLYCFFLSFSVIATSACTDDKEEREFPPAPDFSLMILKENLHSNGGDVLRTDTYVYDNNKLTTHHITGVLRAEPAPRNDSLLLR